MSDDDDAMEHAGNHSFSIRTSRRSSVRGSRGKAGRTPTGGNWAASLRMVRDELAKAIEAIDALPPTVASRVHAVGLTSAALAHADLAVRMLREAGR